MLRSLAFTISIIVALFVSLSEVRAQDAKAEANQLFVEAVTLYRGSQAATGSAKSDAFAKVRSLFDQILSDYPGSRPATVIAEGGSPGGVPLASLPSSKPKGWNEGKRDIVRDFLDAYGGDIERLSAVASTYEWAVLACAAYSEDGAVCRDDITGGADVLTSEIGWTPGEPLIGDYLGVGQAVAYLYKNDDGRAALVYRGSDEGRDFVTNILGTADPSFLNAAQLRFAVKLAEEAVASHPTITFVGHSLGGRLAQIGTLSTGRPAIAFNSAPVGSWETIRYAHTFERRDELVTRLRGPDDPVSVIPPQKASDQIEVSNMALTGDGFARNVVNAKSYTHSMSPLAGAVQRVHEAESLGWVAAYLDEQETSNELRSPSGRWGASIVPANGAELGYRPCGDRTDIRRCLEEKGLGKDAIDFSFAVAGDLVGEVFAIDFQETGEIDVAHVEFNGASPHQWPILLNGSAGEITLEATNNLAAVFTDPTSQEMLRRFPQASSRSAQIRSHRLLGRWNTTFCSGRNHHRWLPSLPDPRQCCNVP